MKTAVLQKNQEQEYQHLLVKIKSHIHSAQVHSARLIQKGVHELYWKIGGEILERQRSHGFGKSVVERLSIDLRNELGNQIGLSPQNLWNMRQFRVEYDDQPKLQQLVGEIPWGHNMVLIAKVKSLEARRFYLEACKNLGWSRSELVQQIRSQAWEHAGKKIPNTFNQSLPEKQAEQTLAFIKDTYALDYLDVAKPAKEREIENAMVLQIRQTLLEFGRGFAFLGNQFRVSFGRKDVFIDLLFFHRHLKCLVAIELKAGAFEPEYAGKLNYYLNVLDEHVKLPEENPSIGILLCADRDEIDVEYALRGIEKPMGVAEYKLTKTLPQSIRKHLPGANVFKPFLKEERK